MPYATDEDLPPVIRSRLPPHARAIFRAAFNAAWSSYGEHAPSRREEIAHRVAWATVKKSYRKVGGAWRPAGLSS